MFPCGAGGSGGAGAGVDIEIEHGKKRATTTWEARRKWGREGTSKPEGGEKGDIPNFGRLAQDNSQV